MFGAMTRCGAVVAAVIGATGIGAADAGVPYFNEQPACLVFNANYTKQYFSLYYTQTNFWKYAQVTAMWGYRPASGAWTALTDHWESGPRLISLTSNVAGNNCDISITLELDPSDYTVDGKIYVRCTSYSGVVQRYQGYLVSGC